MNFPGDNSMTLSKDVVSAMLAQHFGTMFQDATVRVTSLEVKSYPTRLVVDFTTDPAPRNSVEV
jgi:hypothetical protein